MILKYDNWRKLNLKGDLKHDIEIWDDILGRKKRNRYKEKPEDDLVDEIKYETTHKR